MHLPDGKSYAMLGVYETTQGIAVKYNGQLWRFRTNPKKSGTFLLENGGRQERVQDDPIVDAHAGRITVYGENGDYIPSVYFEEPSPGIPPYEGYPYWGNDGRRDMYPSKPLFERMLSAMNNAYRDMDIVVGKSGNPHLEILHSVGRFYIVPDPFKINGLLAFGAGFLDYVPNDDYPPPLPKDWRMN